MTKQEQNLKALINLALSKGLFNSSEAVIAVNESLQYFIKEAARIDVLCAEISTRDAQIEDLRESIGELRELVVKYKNEARPVH